MPPDLSDPLAAGLRAKADWVWRRTIRFHMDCPDTRIASSLSLVEVFTCLFYGGLLFLDPRRLDHPDRDRLVISKGHGSIAMYPILGDLGFFDLALLDRTLEPGSFLGSIPDPVIPGYETVNGSLGHGPGVAAGMAYALRLRDKPQQVVVVVGDGELYEGSVWEALMFSGHHRLDNLTLVLDNNRKSMLGLCEEILRLEPLEPRFKAFGWEVERVDGHDLAAVHAALSGMLPRRQGRPKVLIADTIKGHGVPELEADPLCHIRTLPGETVLALLEARP